jgi:hypothetical protein
MDLKCKYPGCMARGKETWALVPLCDGHHEAIRWETIKFYEGERVKTDDGYRPEYKKIAHLTPWRKKVGL